ncbi:MAG: YraN family protein, partial [Candidatus Dadabacteria bacterium]|nr:YraN family protein [Candidatus Dadabacteria bacterium]
MKLLSRISSLIKDTFDKTDKKSAGDFGERRACKFMKKNGYSVIEKNFRTRYGEIDLIATDGDTLCFIEVKARSSAEYGSPEEFVTIRKQQRLWKTASLYIDKNSP